MLRNEDGLLKSTIGIILYVIIALFLYDMIAEATYYGSPITGLPSAHLFTPIDYSILFISFFAIFYVFVFYLLVIYTFGYFAYVKPEKFDRYFISILTIYAIAYLTYLIFPVAMIRPLRRRSFRFSF